MYILSSVVNMGCYLKSRHHKLEMSKIWLRHQSDWTELTLCNSTDCSTPGFPVQHQLPKLAQTHVDWIGDAIQPSHPVVPFSCLQSFPASGSFLVGQFFASGGQNIGTSASTSVLSMNFQDWFPLGWTGWISFSPRDSQESSPTPQFKSMHSSALSFLYSPTLTSIHDYWKNHSFD